MKKLNIFLTLLLATSAMAESDKELTKIEKNQPLIFMGIISCSANDYAWGGSYPNPNDNKQHDKTITLAKNSSPLENKIMFKSNKPKILMVDNDEFQIVKKNHKEVMAEIGRAHV